MSQNDLVYLHILSRKVICPRDLRDLNDEQVGNLMYYCYNLYKTFRAVHLVRELNKKELEVKG